MEFKELLQNYFHYLIVQKSWNLRKYFKFDIVINLITAYNFYFLGLQVERQILWSNPSLRRGTKTRYSFRFIEISWNSYLNEWIDLIFEQVSQFCKKNYYFCIIALCYFLYHCTLLFSVSCVELGHSSISNKVKRPYWKIMYSFMSPMKMIRC